MAVPLEMVLFGGALLVFFSVFASKASDKLGVPALLVFLLIGMLAGSEGIGKIYFQNYTYANYIGVVALSYILFYGGLGTHWKDVKPVLVTGTVLATFGVFITAVLMALSAGFIFGQLEIGRASCRERV